MMQKTTIRTIFFILVSLSILASGCLGFVPRPTNTVGVAQHRHVSDSSNNVFDRTKSAMAMIPTPDIEAEALTTMAHMTLDFTGFFSPSKNILRLLAVVGRVFVISADYITDHSIHPEELVIQLFLMGIAVREMIVEKEPSTSSEAK